MDKKAETLRLDFVLFCMPRVALFGSINELFASKIDSEWNL